MIRICVRNKITRYVILKLLIVWITLHPDSSFVLSEKTEKVRLSNTKNTYRGNVEVWYEKAWQPVCGDNLTEKTASVICQSLGFSMFKQYAQIEESESTLINGSCAVFISCEGREPSIERCNFPKFQNNSCSCLTVASVNCFGKFFEPSHWERPYEKTTYIPQYGSRSHPISPSLSTINDVHQISPSPRKVSSERIFTAHVCTENCSTAESDLFTDFETDIYPSSSSINDFSVTMSDESSQYYQTLLEFPDSSVDLDFRISEYGVEESYKSIPGTLLSSASPNTVIIETSILNASIEFDTLTVSKTQAFASSRLQLLYLNSSYEDESFSPLTNFSREFKLEPRSESISDVRKSFQVDISQASDQITTSRLFSSRIDLDTMSVATTNNPVVIEKLEEANKIFVDELTRLAILRAMKKTIKHINGKADEIILTTKAYRKLGCINNYKFVSKLQRCYRMHDGSVNARVAALSCNKENSQLVSFESKRELNVVGRHIAQTHNRILFWTSARVRHGQLVWSNDHNTRLRINAYRWYPRFRYPRPDSDHCIGVYAEKGRKPVLFDSLCDKARVFMCESDPIYLT